MLVRVTYNQSHTSVHPEKTANISRRHQWLTREITSEKPPQKFRTNDLGSASDWMKQILNQSEAVSRHFVLWSDHSKPDCST